MADLALCLPEFSGHSDLAGQRPCFVQVLYGPSRVAFELAQDCQGAQVGYAFPLVGLGALGETVGLFSGASFVSSLQQGFDDVIEVENIQHIEGGPILVHLFGVGVSFLPVVGEDSYSAEPDGVEHLVLWPQRPSWL